MKKNYQLVRKIKKEKTSTNFFRLKEIMQKLNSNEIRMVRAYLKAISRNFSDENFETKEIELFDLIAADPNISQEDAMGHCDNSYKIHSFEVLTGRLKEKIGYCLVNENFTQRKEAYSERYQAIFEIRQKLSLAEILIGRDIFEEGMIVLNRVISLCKKYEVYNELIDSLIIKRHCLNIRVNLNEYNTLTNEIKFYEKCKTANNKAAYWFDIHLSYVDFNGVRTGYLNIFEKAIQELDEEYNITKSATVAYFKYLIKIEYYQELKMYDIAEIAAKELLELVSHNVAIYQPYRLGTSYVNLANTSIYQKKYKRSFLYLNEAQKLYLPNSFHFSITEELEFYAHFYSGNYEKALEKISGILKNIHYKQSIYVENKRKFMYACSLFVLKDYNKCQEILNEIEDIHDDKAGWNIGMRVLNIMLDAFKKDHENTRYKIESFRKHVERLKKLREVRKRDILILDILNNWVKCNYDFKEIYKKRKKDFDLLNEPGTDYQWQIKSHELIVFHKWFEAMVKRKPYHNIVR
jgi:hypothetical protein